jgi:hypothetical protein
MAGFSTLGLGLLLGGVGGAIAGGLAGRGKKEPTAPGTVRRRTNPNAAAPAATPAATPPDAVQMESQGVSSARTAAAKTKRRAAAGNAGRATTGLAGSQLGVSASGSGRGLLGY